MRRAALVLFSALLAACGGGGSTAPAPTLEPEQEQFHSLGLVRGDAPTAVTFVVTKPFDEAGTVELLGTADGPFSPPPLPMTVPAAQKFALTVVFTPPPAPPSLEQRGTLPLLLRRASGGAAFPVTLRLDAEIEVPSARLVDTHVQLGRAANGETVPFSVRIENTSAVTPITVSRATLSGGEGFAIFGTPAPATVAPGATLSLPLVYAPATEGSSAATLLVFHSVSADPFVATLEGAGMLPLVAFDYGFVPLDPVSGDSDWLAFDVGPDGTAIFIEAWGVPDALLDLMTLEGPKGQVAVDWLGTHPAGAFGCLNLQVPDYASGDAAPAEGAYRFRLRDGMATGADIRVRALVSQRRDAEMGTLDLRVFVAGGLSIPDPVADPKLATAIGTIDAVLGAEGIRLGEVSFVPLDPRFDVLHDETERVNMLMVGTAARPEGALNLFLVRGIDGGFSATAPTPGPRWNGTPFSGVIVDFDDPTGVAAGAV
ncbi:MAG: hypothetical protein L6Q95_17195, partial [Planctomycetes bacterium]|nr:hypothetical protein [Planctomycetota bacterium]